MDGFESTRSLGQANPTSAAFEALSHSILALNYSASEGIGGEDY